jgi:uroporphyrinogen-III synthase
VLERLRRAAIGPATAAALSAAGLPPTISGHEGYTSEALLQVLEVVPGGQAFIAAAPGGRDALLKGLRALGWQARMLMVYRAEPAPLAPDLPGRLQQADRLLSVWTSSNAMQALAQRLPPAAWVAVCRGDWLVISERLARLARTYAPDRVHLAGGPGNADLLRAIRSLVVSAGR